MAQVTSQVEVSHQRAAGPPWRRRTFALALLGSLLMFAAQPPLDWGALAWVAPVPWLLLIRQKRLEGARPYRALWGAGFIFWLLAIHWLRLPHWATYFGWLALSFYLAFYLPVFVGLTRVAVHRLGVSLVAAAPVVWAGLELARAHLLSGFLMGALGHTQYRWTELIQISDLGGAYTVSFLVMLVAACLARIVPWDGKRPAIWPPLPAAAMVGAALLYGHWRLNEATLRPGPRVALIQGSIDADWKADPDKNQRIFDEYFRLSAQAVRKARGPLDLIVWPETMYRNALFDLAPGFEPTAEKRAMYLQADAGTRAQIARMAAALGAPLMLGLDTVELTARGPLAYNSAIGATRAGEIVGRYSKMHRVMFGEYVPLAKTFPWLYELTPLGGGLEPGKRPAAFTLNGYAYAPNICYESSIPQVIRNQARTLIDEGHEPDVLVNLTNDAWFWGSSELDMHLACAVFRAIEMRKPFLISANGGISAHIDSLGRILEQSPKRKSDVILAQVELDSRRSPYLIVGDWPAGVCLLGCVGLALIGLRDRRWAKQHKP